MRRLSVVFAVVGLVWFAGLAADGSAGNIWDTKDPDTSKVAPAYRLGAPWIAQTRATTTEGFEGGVIPPAGWTQHITNADETWYIDNAGAHSGDNAARVDYDSALVPQAEALYSPELNPTWSFSVSLWTYGSVYWAVDMDTYDVNVYLDDDNTWNNGNETLVYTVDGDWPADWTYAQSTMDLTSYITGAPLYVAIVYEGVDGAQANLDDIEIVIDEWDIPEPSCPALFEEEFNGGTFPPTGWTVIDNLASGGVWEDGSTSGCGETNDTGGTGAWAEANTDCHSTPVFDTELRTPSIDLTGITGAILEFKSAYENYANYDYARVWASGDGGSSWDLLQEWNEDHSGPDTVQLDLSAYDGVSNLVISFQYDTDGNTYLWYWQIDDVKVLVGCDPADIEVYKETTATTVMVGGPITYTITISNHGPENATNVVITDQLPPELGAPVSDTCGGVYDGGSNTWTWTIAALANGAQVSCDLTAMVLSDGGGTIENTAQMTALDQYDYFPDDDAWTVAVQAERQIEAIPTLTGLGIALLVMLLAGVGLLILRRFN